MTPSPPSASLDDAPATVTTVAERDQLSRVETAKRLGVSVQTVDRYVLDGTLTPEKNPVTKRVWFDRAQVDALAKLRGAGR